MLLPLLLPWTAAGGEVLLASDTLTLAACCCCLSDLLEALEGVRLNGSRLGGDAVGFFVRLEAEAAGGVRLADGSLAENCERAGVVALRSEGGEDGVTGDNSTRCTCTNRTCGCGGRGGVSIV